jgi:hypothetical protein
MQVFNNLFSDQDLIDAERELSTEIEFRRAPAWLGPFDMACFGEGYGRGRKLPPACRRLALGSISKLPAHTPAGTPIRYNAAFVQRYRPGFKVLPHFDPSSNLGYTSILSLGIFDPPPVLSVDGFEDLSPARGALVVLPCWLDGKPGPRHSVQSHEDQVGTRYTLIVNSVSL